MHDGRRSAGPPVSETVAPSSGLSSDEVDPRSLLAQWANENDEWVRVLVGEVIATGRAVGESVITQAHQHFRQEKALDERVLPAVPHLSTEARQDESAPPLALSRLSEVRGVNALSPGAVIEPHAGLTILYGENGTGKTGYSRIFKALADSRTADVILPNIESHDETVQSAKIEYSLGSDAAVLEWDGSRGVSPFTRMSIFDTPCVTAHVDDDLDYVYTPAALALFNHVIAGIQAVTARIDAEITGLESTSGGILGRFHRGSTIYPQIETLGASTDLVLLREKASTDAEVDTHIEVLTETVAALRSNTIAAQLASRRREERVLEQAMATARALQSFGVEHFNATLATRARLADDYAIFRSELFAAADLPAEPDQTWSDFVAAGDVYRQHLFEVDAHDSDRCLYCRQVLAEPARDLLTRYSTYLEDKISDDIQVADSDLASFKSDIAGIQLTEVDGFVTEQEVVAEKPDYLQALQTIGGVLATVRLAVDDASPLAADALDALEAAASNCDEALELVSASVLILDEQAQNRTQVLTEKQSELLELKDAAELTKTWPIVDGIVTAAKEADRLRSLKRPLPQLGRSVTALAKTASDQLINQSFDTLFLEECEALRAPSLKVQFVGREGKAQRRKILSGKHKPSKVLSEGEQKVLALADFLAEARLAGITAPVIFDDPVSSLDHRRVNEVARRIAKLAAANQVIVFTHDILFATTLLALFETSKRCSYFQISDEDGKGKVTRATGPRWDTMNGIRGKIKSTIEAAKQQEGDARDALVRVGYGWIRSWIEVFTETELLQGVTQRYQPNVGMTRLAKINTDKLGEVVPRLMAIFEDACRYIDGHSQPLVTLGVSPTLAGLERDWAELQELKKIHDGKS